MCIFVVVHCAFNILVARVFARYATTVHNDNKKIFNLIDMEKELDGDMVEKRLYEEVSDFYKNKEVVVLIFL